MQRARFVEIFHKYVDYFHLLSKEYGVDEDHIIQINLEDVEFHDVLDDYVKLYKKVMEQIKDNKKYYVFLDEVQKVKSFQSACDGLYIKKNIDLYITGSNSYLFSGELASNLRGRYIEIPMLPLESVAEGVSSNVIFSYEPLP